LLEDAEKPVFLIGFKKQNAYWIEAGLIRVTNCFSVLGNGHYRTPFLEIKEIKK